MKCSCIKEFNKELQRQTSDPDAKVLTSLSISNGKASVIPYMSAEYKSLKKDGSFKSGKTKVHVFPNYCPFCGISLADEKTVKLSISSSSEWVKKEDDTQPPEGMFLASVLVQREGVVESKHDLFLAVVDTETSYELLYADSLDGLGWDWSDVDYYSIITPPEVKPNV